MQSQLDKSIKILSAWGANASQVEAILTSEFIQSELEARTKHIIAIQECLELLFSEQKRRVEFMAKKNKSALFPTKKPLEIMSSGSLHDLEEVHAKVRSMVCI
ncbi:hypothetical protein JCM19236_3859 [Vibrio sp. JCM 19236]|nr:hypothetical protein JCM19236_3859 [Vibrio sp. JCM 19236]